MLFHFLADDLAAVVHLGDNDVHTLERSGALDTLQVHVAHALGAVGVDVVDGGVDLEGHVHVDSLLGHDKRVPRPQTMFSFRGRVEQFREFIPIVRFIININGLSICERRNRKRNGHKYSSIPKRWCFSKRYEAEESGI